MPRLTDDEIASICEQEIESASGYASGELAAQRAEAMDRYLGEPYGNEVAGRSQIVSRETLDTIESIMPQLMRIFADADNLAVFDAVGPEDEQQAEQESDRVNNAFWKDNNGFYNLYTFCKDALLSKTGNLKAWWQDAEPAEREEYRGLTDDELSELMNDTTIQREIVEYEWEPEKGHHVVFTTVQQNGKCIIEAVTPEEFGVNRDARSPYAQDVRFCYHRVRKTYGYLIAAGYSKKQIDQIPVGEDAETEERLARRNLSDESDSLDYGTNKRTSVYWVTECYLRIDRDDSGVEQILKVTLATGSVGTGSGELLDIEEVDAIPFFTASPILLTHKFNGLSIADLLGEIEEVKTTLLRQVLDNTYLANNIRTHINENVNIDDMMTRRPGGITRHKGQTIPGQNMAPEPFTPLPPHVFSLFEYLDEMKKGRTGSGDEIPGLDATSLANVNTGVAALAYDQMRARIELIARILAEVGLVPLLRHVHELLQKHQDKSEVVKLRNRWVEINPSEWRTRKNMTVQVGLGISSRERRLVALEKVIQRQAEIIKAGGFGTLLMPHHVYEAMADEADALGMEPSKYFQDPRMLPPQPPKGPSVEQQALMAQAQAQMMAAKAQGDRNHVEAAKVQSAERIRVMELQNAQMEQHLKRQVESLKNDRAELKSQRDMAEQTARSTLDAEIKMRDQEIRMAESRLKDQQESAKRENEMLKALLQSGTVLTQEQMKLTGADGEGGFPTLIEQLETKNIRTLEQFMGGLTEVLQNEIGGVRGVMESQKAEAERMVAEMQAKMMEQEERARAPKDVKRDERGLIISIGEIPVVRDESGSVVRVG